MVNIEPLVRRPVRCQLPSPTSSKDATAACGAADRAGVESAVVTGLLQHPGPVLVIGFDAGRLVIGCLVGTFSGGGHGAILAQVAQVRSSGGSLGSSRR